MSKLQRLTGIIKYRRIRLGALLSPYRSAWCCLFFILLIISSSPMWAQQQVLLKLHAFDQDTFFIKKNITYQNKHKAAITIPDELQQIVKQLHQKAYLEASIDSLSVQDSTHHAWLHVGKTYQWATLRNGNVEAAFLNQIGFRERLYQNKPFVYQKIIQVQDDLLTYAENNGYPFAEVWLDSLVIQNGELSAELMMKKNQLVFIKDIIIKGKVKISKTYLENYLGLKKGMPYNKAKVLKIRDRIKELPFLKEDKDVSIKFEEDQATIFLSLKKKNASKFDFVVGFLPPPQNLPNQPARPFLLTGSFNGEMQNQFGVGERLYAEFERLRPETQQLGVEFSYPFILDLPFGVDASIYQFKRDTTNNNVSLNVGVQYLLEGGNYVKAFWDNTSSNLLEIDTLSIKNRGELPSNLDVSRSAFGLEYVLQKLDYRFNPRKGWAMLLRGSAGLKNIKKNSKILDLSTDEVNFSALYDSLGTRSFQYKIDTKLETYIPIAKLFTLKLANQSGVLLSDNLVLQNEQYRIGGNRILRGFDEESIFATFYSIFTLEYRWLIGQNSYFYAFGDYAYVNNPLQLNQQEDDPLGFGVGINFETGVGIFGLSLAVGRQLGNALDFGSPKVHFGYVSLF